MSNLLNSLLQDLRHGVRQMGKNPGLSIGAVLVLGFGISANAVIFGMANAYLLRAPNFAEPQQLVHVWETNKRQGYNQIRASLPNYVDWKTQNTVFSDMAVFNYTGESLIGTDGPERVQSGRVSANALDVLGVMPALGRGFEEGEDEPGKGGVAILMHRFWQQRYGGKADAIGQKMRINDRVHEIVGVMPESFAFPLTTTQILLPRELDPNRTPRDTRYLQVMARLKPGVTRAQAQAEMSTIAERLAREYPQANADTGVNLAPLHESLNFAYDVLSAVLGVLGVAGIFLLLVSCANVANLMMARAIGRLREMAIRAALGASRGRVVRQLLTESALLAFAGGAAGTLMADWLLRGAASVIPDDLYRVGALEMDGAAMAFTAGLCLLTAVIFGLAPALQISRPNLTEALKEGTLGAATGKSRHRLHSFLTVAQVSLSLVLLSGAALITQAFLQLQKADFGYDTTPVLTMTVSLPRATYDTDEKRIEFHRRVVQETAAVAGVSAAATSSYLPLNHETAPTEIQTEREAAPARGQERTASTMWVSPGFFETAGVRLRSGRGFTAQDATGSPAVVVINETAQKRLFAAGDAVGRTVYLKQFGQQEVRAATVVGVAGDIRYSDEFEGVLPMQIYVSSFQEGPNYFRVLARSAGGQGAQVASAVRAAIWRVDGTLPITEVRTMEEVVAESLLPRQAMAVALAVFGVGALALAAIGLYGIVSNWVAQRTREIGIRMALGASAQDILRMVLRQGVTLVGVGATIGFAGSLGVAKLLTSVIAGLTLLDPLALLAGPALLIGVTLLACYLPARRATRVDPLVALRYE